MSSARFVNELVALIAAAIADPAASDPLVAAAADWLDREGKRYQLTWALRSLLTQIRATPSPVDPAVLAGWQAIAADLDAQYNPPRNPYIDPDVARAEAIALGLYTEDLAPDAARFAAILDRLATRMEQWLGWRVAIATYTRRLESDRYGRIRLPVPRVQGVEHVILLVPQMQGKPIELTDVPELWDSDRVICTGFPSAKFEVCFTAGLDPVPEEITDSLYDLLIYAIARDASLRSSDLSQLDQPDREVEQVSLPGGLSKKFAVPRPASDDSNESVIDRLLEAIADYRIAGNLIC